MNKKHITPEIIKLSKEIAKYWRMEIYEGCWVLQGGLVKLVYQKLGQFTRVIIECEKRDVLEGNLIPIPSISDCLEKLSGITTSIEKELLGLVTNLWRGYHTNIIEFHETLLSALLEVLKNGEKQ